MKRILEIHGKHQSVVIKRKGRTVTFYHGGTLYSNGPRLEVRANGYLSCDLGMKNVHLFLIPKVVRSYIKQHCNESILLNWGKPTVSIVKRVNGTDLFFDNFHGAALSKETIKLIGECAEKFIALNFN